VHASIVVIYALRMWIFCNAESYLPELYFVGFTDILRLKKGWIG
jgi:hypothetical protein